MGVIEVELAAESDEKSTWIVNQFEVDCRMKSSASGSGGCGSGNVSQRMCPNHYITEYSIISSPRSNLQCKWDLNNDSALFRQTTRTSAFLPCHQETIWRPIILSLVRVNWVSRRRHRWYEGATEWAASGYPSSSVCCRYSLWRHIVRPFML